MRFYLFGLPKLHTTEVGLCGSDMGTRRIGSHQADKVIWEKAVWGVMMGQLFLVIHLASFCTTPTMIFPWPLLVMTCPREPSSMLTRGSHHCPAVPFALTPLPSTPMPSPLKCPWKIPQLTEVKWSSLDYKPGNCSSGPEREKREKQETTTNANEICERKTYIFYSFH